MGGSKKQLLLAPLANDPPTFKSVAPPLDTLNGNVEIAFHMSLRGYFLCSFHAKHLCVREFHAKFTHTQTHTYIERESLLDTKTLQSIAVQKLYILVHTVFKHCSIHRQKHSSINDNVTTNSRNTSRLQIISVLF